MRTRQVAHALGRLLDDRDPLEIWPAACVRWAADHLDRLASRRRLLGGDLSPSFRRTRLYGLFVRPSASNEQADAARSLLDQLESRAYAWRHGYPFALAEYTRTLARLGDLDESRAGTALDIRLDTDVALERTRFELRQGRGYGKTERTRQALEQARLEGRIVERLLDNQGRS